jgi:antitoxin YefM
MEKFVSTRISTYFCTNIIQKNMKTANYTDLRNNLKSYIDSVIDDSDTVIINRGGGAGIVLMSLDEYNALKETEYIMSSLRMVQRIKEAQKEMHAGEGKVINIDDLWK